ncbi:DUF4397 domain-containing protein [Paraflavitalea sp. CAU 1676]|uniref:DUF4397 domain-containing protein n=1 Tax=Paraflavitalea sp. CAU 1676 TaxID=3032598 RepID=UPI0023DA4465|nr:DUF4397 domain-containing protein [Paraflavitalea sp. CAU 1676]MDF2189931.1 hypothetical protein [Paraflavitalea sp. CAU 1676]
MKITLWSLVAMIGISLTGCLKATDPQPQAAKAYVSILHLATVPTALSTDVYFDDKKVSTNAFPPGGVPQFYSQIEVDGFKIDFKKANGDSLMANVPFALYDSLGFYSVILYNPTSTSNAMKAMRIEDDFSSLSLDKTFFRFWHLSPSVNDLGPVDLYIDNNKVASNRTLADNEFSDYQNIFQTTTSGSHSIKIKLSNKDTVIYQSPSDVSFQSGNAYTLYLAGNTGGADANKLTVGSLRAANN